MRMLAFLVLVLAGALAGWAIMYEYLFLEAANVVQDGEPNMQELETLHLKSG